MTERMWAMTRIGSGDYGLLSNDRSTLWRLQRYDERDGTLSRGDGTVIHGTFWRLLRWKYEPDALAYEDIDAWSNWIECQCLLPTRQAAIDAAMEREPVAP